MGNLTNHRKARNHFVIDTKPDTEEVVRKEPKKYNMEKKFKEEKSEEEDLTIKISGIKSIKISGIKF